MKILSIDTASDVCGVSILEDYNLICNLDITTGRTHSENLMPLIQEVFSKNNLSLKDIDLIVCDKGPGSFTGIRIGVATTKAFSDSLNIPCIGISSLESLAYNIKDSLNDEEYIFSIIDCKNNNCYFAVYQFKDNQFVEIVSPNSDSIESFKNLENEYKNKIINFIGDGSIIYKEFLSSVFKNAKFSDKNLLNSYSLGLAGLDKFNKKQFDDVLPLYLKKPQAQRQLEEKQLN